MRNMKGILVKFRDFFLCKCYIISENINNELLKEEDFNNQESEENQESILNSLEDLKMNLEEKTIPIKEQEEAKELFQNNDNLLQI